MSQPLPLSPQIPAFDGRMPASRERPVEDGERGTQRHAFGRLLDRFTRPDRDPEDAPTDSLAGPQERRPRERCADLDDAPRPIEDALKSEADSLEPIGTEVSAPPPVARRVELPMPVIDAGQASGNPAGTAAALPVVTPEALPATPVAVTTMPPAADAAVGTAGVTAVATAAPATPTATPTELTAEVAAAAAGARAVDPAAAHLASGRRTASATDAGERTTPSVKAATTGEKLLAEPIAPPTIQLPKQQPDGEAAPTADSTQALRQVRIASAGPAAATTAPAALVAGREESQGGPSAADQPVIVLQGMDSPRSAAALYHKVADAARPGGDTPSAADQVSVRLIHAVAEGKRAIQMHLHPAELGSIDVKMQWQGDRLTAQFLVDRPETLQLLQREVPALERSLGQAGIDLGGNGLSFSLRQQQGNGQGGQPFNPGAGDPAFADGADLPAGDEPLGQVIRDGILSIRV